VAEGVGDRWAWSERVCERQSEDLFAHRDACSVMHIMFPQARASMFASQ
jgi:hypothetical protein